ncbi:Major facilitator superfamily domain,Major facilitator, sugar transporter-like [Cinara cedri]|uniref:Major facilitator superfamily domain,Major facilitator, sugar transporter-like n=1 Tax=Cinara cedri TaxID=506608 RepID=A0A5E4MDG0_9HEMI|nr:Major facilitator superfamily domain,Major facilitator, sugar transporter-like [Cinara cedri]
MADGRFKTVLFTYATVIIASSGSLLCGIWDEWSQMSGINVHRHAYVYGGLFIVGYLLSVVGRKPTIALIGPLYVVCWSVVLVLPSVPLLNFMVNVFVGTSKAMAFVTIPVYVGEVAEVNYRGSALTIFAIMYTMGSTLMQAAGLVLTHQQLCVMGLSLSVVFSVLFITGVPESPYYYAQMDHDVMANKSLRRIRGRDDVSVELADIEHTVDVHMIPNRNGYCELLINEATWKAFFSTAMSHFVQAHCGYIQFKRSIHALLPFKNVWMRPEIAFIWMSVIENFGNLITALLVERLGRKPLMILSYSAMAIVQMVVMILPIPAPRIPWAPIVLMWLHGLSFGLGAASLSSTLLGEMFTMNIKTKAVPLCVLILHISFMNIMNVQAEGWPVTNFQFALCIIINIAWIIYTKYNMVETKGKTFLEIQKLLTLKS